MLFRFLVRLRGKAQRPTLARRLLLLLGLLLRLGLGRVWHAVGVMRGGLAAGISMFQNRDEVFEQNRRLGADSRIRHNSKLDQNSRPRPKAVVEQDSSLRTIAQSQSADLNPTVQDYSQSALPALPEHITTPSRSAGSMGT